MKKLFLFILTGLFILATGCGKDDAVVTPETKDYQAELQKMIDETWNDYVKNKTNFPGGYAMQIIAPQGSYFVGAGELKTADNKIHFRAASTTKTFTAAGILLLHQRRQLNINHFITDTIPGKSQPYVPDTGPFDIPYKNQITIKQLLQNRAGVFDLINTDIPDTVLAPYAGKRYPNYVIEDLGQSTHTFTTEEMLGILAKHKLCYFKPGERFHYSDTGFNLLGYIIERVSGESYSEFIKTNLLIPNGLSETTFPSTGTDQSIPNEYAPGYAYYQGQKFDVTVANRSMHVAEGNVITTPYDLAAWMKKLLSGEAGIDIKYVQFLMMDTQPTYESHQYYGLGVVFTPGLGYGHNGGALGYWTAARYDPEMNLAFSIFTNVWDFDAIEVDMYTQIFEMYGLVLEAKKLFK